MIGIDVSWNVSELTARLNQVARKQIPFAVATALNDTVRVAKSAVQDSMRKSFHGPVPRTLNSIRFKLATKAKLEAKMWIDDEPGKGIAAAQYLAAEAFGGARKAKRFERALQARGLMPSGMYAVPGAGAPLDGNGNLPGSFVVKLLSYLGAFGETGYRANMTQKRKGKIAGMTRSARGFKMIGGVMYFVANGKGRTAHLAPGIYSKTGIHGVIVKPVILFVRSPRYQIRFPFDRIVEGAVNAQFPRSLRDRLQRALATAR
jgi:hypothetical protein